MNEQTLEIPAHNPQETVETVQPEETRFDRLVRLSVALQRIGVSEKETFNLLYEFDLDLVEQQLAWFPLRSAKKPASLIVAAIRNNYEAPANLMPPPAEPTLTDKLKSLAD